MSCPVADEWNAFIEHAAVGSAAIVSAIGPAASWASGSAGRSRVVVRVPETRRGPLRDHHAVALFEVGDHVGAGARRRHDRAVARATRAGGARGPARAAAPVPRGRRAGRAARAARARAAGRAGPMPGRAARARPPCPPPPAVPVAAAGAASAETQGLPLEQQFCRSVLVLTQVLLKAAGPPAGAVAVRAGRSARADPAARTTIRVVGGQVRARAGRALHQAPTARRGARAVVANLRSRAGRVQVPQWLLSDDAEPLHERARPRTGSVPDWQT